MQPLMAFAAFLLFYKSRFSKPLMAFDQLTTNLGVDQGPVLAFFT